MTTLRLLIALLCVVPRIVWAWLKLMWAETKMPRVPHCRDCGWRLAWDTASLICPPCQEARRQATAKPVHVHTHNGMGVCLDYESCGLCHCHLQDEAHTACCKGKAAREMYAHRQARIENAKRERAGR